MEQPNIQAALQNGNTPISQKELIEKGIKISITPRFLGPPLKAEDFMSDNGTSENHGRWREVQHEILEDGSSFLPLGAGGPGPPKFHTHSEPRIVETKIGSIEPDTPFERFNVDDGPRLPRYPPYEENQEVMDEIIHNLEKFKIAEECVLMEETETVQENGRMSPCGVPPAPPVIPEPTETRVLLPETTKISTETKVLSTEVSNINTETKIVSSESSIKHAETKQEKKIAEECMLMEETEIVQENGRMSPCDLPDKPPENHAETNIDAPEPLIKNSETIIAANNERRRLEFLLGTENIEQFQKKETTMEPAKTMDEGDALTKLQDQVIKKNTACVLKILPPISVDKKTEEGTGNTPPNTPLVESTEPDNTRSLMEEYFRDPSRIPLGAGGPAPSICHPLSRDGIPAQSPTPFSRIAYGEPREILLETAMETTSEIMNEKSESKNEKITTEVEETSVHIEMKSSEIKQEKELKSSSIIKMIQKEMNKKSEVLEENKLPVEETTKKEEKSPDKEEKREEETELRQKTNDEPRTKSVSVDETAMRNLRGQSLPPEVAKKPEKPARGAIARLASGDGTTAPAKPAVGLSIAAPRRSHSFIGFSTPSMASKVAGSVHAHRQQFLQRRMLFETPESFENKKTTMRKFEIELKALKLGNKSLCDSWVTEEKEDVQSTSRLQRTSLRASFIHRRSTEKPILETESKEESKE